MQEDFMRRAERLKSELERRADLLIFGNKGKRRRGRPAKEEYPVLSDRQIYERRRREFNLQPIEHLDLAGRLLRPPERYDGGMEPREIGAF